MRLRFLAAQQRAMHLCEQQYGEAASGLRLSLGPWLGPSDLEGVPAALARARKRLGPTGSG